ncbi:MAG: hypothetical protein REI78_14775 [Pedobacter sp.]|nr:hypothetical protein [Pedobacter sp.]
MKFNLRASLILSYSILCSCSYGVKDEAERTFIGNDYSGVKSSNAIELLKLGDKNINDQKYDAALEYYLKADKVEPDNSTILNSIANTESYLGKTEHAFSHFRKAIEIDSSYLHAYASYGTSLGESKRYDEAIKILKIGYEKSSPSQFVHYALSFNLAIYYYKNGNCKSANDYIKIALKNKFKNKNFDTEIFKVAKIINENCKP